ncbi:hypothetical protein BKA67DRAFT_662428 [Truncatella angustata]|uniref:Uncharacterized protein n=1 Tax=Truncatella angustata TaxID=152316 RepID=A0A9P8RKS6_9PEZI|nr:uncharacterized protein BKA67DRAFT_662428 [Truncatella angustata]KAH6647656.1 hypothetical protein BKA67DRAFT_662428 [Truncatella angustata]
MAVPGTVQALIAAFFFGILLNTASAGFVLYIKGHGSAIFRDGLRLALILFLASSALWAQAEFLATLIEPTSISTCQIAVIISSFLDQIARVSIEQFLVWALAKDGLKSPAAIATQIILLVRFIVGMVFVGETKPQFNSTCVPMSNVVPISIAVIALDAVILISTAVMAFTTGSKKSGQGTKALLLTISALAVWMGTSVTMLLGLSTIDMFLRTTLPTVGLFILSALVTILSGNLAMPQERHPRQPLESPTPQSMSRDRDLSTSDSNDYPPSRYEEVKGIGGMNIAPFSEPNIQPKGYNGETVLPTLARPVTGGAGIGGVPVQGQLFPPLRSNTVDQVPMLQTMVPSRIDMLKRSKTDPPRKIGKGKLAISAPIPINDPEAQDAFNKIPTVDLATAAKNEQERRDGYARRISALMATRPAPKPPTLSPEEVTRRATTLKQSQFERESSVEIERSNSTKTSQTNGLSVEGNASTTSAQLSPGNEELRRRSPRQNVPSALPAKTPTFQPVTPGQPFRIPIPRAQPPPEPVPDRLPEPVKTPLQRRPTIGLPSNPRAMTVKKLSEETSKGQPQTVMFINRISYDDPEYVNDIIQGAAKVQFTPLKSSNSVVHRPRPIPRKSDEDRQVYPAEMSSGHRRTKSGGSIISRGSILKSQPGSPTQLPPLPPPPKSAGNSQRPQPNDTRSMTFDEKMSVFYAGPSSSSSMDSTMIAIKRKSSVPEIPPLPATYMPVKQSPMTERPVPIEDARRLTRTTATDQSSIRTQSILGVEGLEEKYLLDTDPDVPDEFGNSWMTGIPAKEYFPNGQQVDGKRRQSSPVIPVLRYSTISATSDGITNDDTATNWASVHSPAVPVDISRSRLNPRSTWIKKDSRLESVLSGFGDEVMTVMLDTSSEQSTSSRQSFLLDDDESRHSILEVETNRADRWHHRVGDNCPTFSARKEKVKSRKMPPPTPLLLRAANNKNAIVIHTAEPSPMESPKAAYNMIQAQLRKLDESSRDSIASEGRRMALLEDLELEMGQQESRWQTMQHNLDRDSISTIQTESRPVSIATPAAKSLTRTSSTSSVLAERRASRRARMLSVNRSKEDLSVFHVDSSNSRTSLFQTRLAAAQMEYMDNAPDLILKRDNLNFFSVSKADLGSPTPPDTDESDSEIISRFQSLNAKIYQPKTKEVHHLWKSPPPKIELLDGLLWEGNVQNSVSTTTVDLPGLSIRPLARKCTDALIIESAQLWRKSQQPEVLENHGLWGAAPLQKKPDAQEVGQVQKARPVTQRPPRKNKRVTLLPDIIENPEPLPNKRGTLGIFQFPWGERSENATIQPVLHIPSQMLRVMPGTMSSSGPRISATLEARARQLEAEEYSSSFFDEYDEEEDYGDNFDDEYDDSGDDFDESTLWEIASLLKTDIPSKNSLLPSSATDSYLVEEPSEDELDEDHYGPLDFVPEELSPTATPLFLRSQNEVLRASLWMSDAQDILSHHSFGLPQPEDDIWQSYLPNGEKVTKPRTHIEDLPALESTQLWVSTFEEASVKPSLWTRGSRSGEERQAFGLTQPDLGVWQMYTSAARETLRSQPRVEELRAIDSTTLWQPRATAPRADNFLLWVAQKTKPSEAPQVSLNKKAQQQRGSFMWQQPIAMSEIPTVGLFEEKSVRLDYRRTSQVPIATSLTPKPRAVKEPLQRLRTQNLWKPRPKLLTRTIGKRQTMWSPTSVKLAQTALFQLDPTRKTYRTTSSEPAALDMTTKSRKSVAPLPQLYSSATWTASSTQKMEIDWIEMSSSHVNNIVPASYSASHGLFRIDTEREDYRTTSAKPAALAMMTKPRKSSAPLPQLCSSQIWMPKSTKTIELDWINISSHLRIGRANILSSGLFKLDMQRKEWRTTIAEPAALHMMTKPRKSSASLERLSSTQFWMSNSTKKAERNWIKVCSSKLTSNDAAAPPPALFKLDKQRKEWRSTGAKPAALDMVTKSRTLIAPLPQLESYRLWSPARTANVQFDWITISSIRPVSPSIASIASSTPSSPITDASSIRTASTKASTVAPSVASGFSLRGFFGRRKKVSPEVPEVPEVAELPEILEAQAEPFRVKNLDELHHTDFPLRQRNRPDVADVGDWEAALREAVAASYPNTLSAPIHVSPKIVRRTATPKEWSTALKQAIAASYPQNRFSRGQLLPSQWDEELCEAIALSQRSLFDVSKRHPVFFGSMTTTAAEVHPAMHGLIMQNGSSSGIAPLLWSQSIPSSHLLVPGALWTEPESRPTKIEAAGLQEIEITLSRKPFSRTFSELHVSSDFGTQATWKHRDTRAQKRDWLNDA